MFDRGAANINIFQTRRTEFGAASRHENRNIFWRKVDDGGSNGIDGCQIRSCDDDADFARRSAVRARAFHADDGIDNGQGGSRRAVDIDNQIRQTVTILETEMELRFRHARNETVLILKCAGERHLRMRFQFRNRDENIVFRQLIRQIQMLENTVVIVLIRFCGDEIDQIGVRFFCDFHKTGQSGDGCGSADAWPVAETDGTSLRLLHFFDDGFQNGRMRRDG